MVEGEEARQRSFVACLAGAPLQSGKNAAVLLAENSGLAAFAPICSAGTGSSVVGQSGNFQSRPSGLPIRFPQSFTVSFFEVDP